jgi:uncharacterized protein (DUF2236 family)
MADVPESAALFPRDAVIRRVNGEGAMLLGGGRALLMQLAHPSVAQGVAEHSDFQNDPFRRLQGTLDAMTTVVFGTAEQAQQVAAILERVHQRVIGPGYSANDPDLLWWVYATLIDTALRVHARFLRPLSDGEARQFYRQSQVVAELLGVPRAHQPADLPGFRAYMRHMVGILEVSDTARMLSREILHPRLPRVAEPVAEPALIVFRQLTVGLTPRPLREQYGMSWDASRKVALLAAGVAARQVLPRIPAMFRRIPVAA